jgi:hypothetical protein
VCHSVCFILFSAFVDNYHFDLYWKTNSKNILEKEVEIYECKIYYAVFSKKFNFLLRIIKIYIKYPLCNIKFVLKIILKYEIN